MLSKLRPFPHPDPHLFVIRFLNLPYARYHIKIKMIQRTPSYSRLQILQKLKIEMKGFMQTDLTSMRNVKKKEFCETIFFILQFSPHFSLECVNQQCCNVPTLFETIQPNISFGIFLDLERLSIDKIIKFEFLILSYRLHFRSRTNFYKLSIFLQFW